MRKWLFVDEDGRSGCRLGRRNLSLSLSLSLGTIIRGNCVLIGRCRIGRRMECGRLLVSCAMLSWSRRGTTTASVIVILIVGVLGSGSRVGGLRGLGLGLGW